MSTPSKRVPFHCFTKRTKKTIGDPLGEWKIFQLVPKHWRTSQLKVEQVSSLGYSTREAAQAFADKLNTARGE